MNIDTFEKEQVNSEAVHEDSFVFDEANAIKQKIHVRKGKQKKIKIMLLAGAVTIVVLSIATAYSQYRLHVLSQEESKAAIAQVSSAPKTGEEVVKALSRHILVPEGVPQIAEVQDAPKLKETQAFFKDVEQGDIVIVYSSTIFIYRPSRDIVVASGDISGVGQLKP